MRLFYHPLPLTWASCSLFPLSWAFIPESMAAISSVLVVIVDFESVRTYKSLIGCSVMLQPSSCRPRELLGVLLSTHLVEGGHALVFRMCQIINAPLPLKLSSGLS